MDSPKVGVSKRTPFSAMAPTTVKLAASSSTAWGIGAANVAGNDFLLRALREVPGAVTFPLRDAGVIALVSLTGVVLFRERPGRFGYAAIAAAALAVVLMSL